VICSDEFEALATAQAMSLQVPDLPLITVPHPISALREDAVRGRAKEALRSFAETMSASRTPEKSPATHGERIHADSSLDEVQELFLARGWTDGLPVIPPTEARVEAMLSGVAIDRSASIGSIPPLRGEATVELIAANAVMAGCDPSYMPVIVAAVRAVLDPAFNLFGVQPTTHPAAPLLVVNGPAIERLDLNAGAGAFGPGRRANATIGRALRLILMNVGGARPGELDKATLGHPGKYSYCIAENEGASPWGPLHVERGFAPEDSTVTVIPAEAPHNINDHTSRTGEGLLMSVAGAIAQAGANNNWYDGDILLVLSPEHAHTLAADGFTKEAVKEYVFEHARTPMATWSEDQQEIRFRRKWPDLYRDADAAQTLIPIVRSPERVNVIVAGGPGKHSMHIPTIGIGVSVTRRIDD
jgi:hypothetical protein